MTRLTNIEIEDYQALLHATGHMRIGHYFLFIDDAATTLSGLSGRLGRLLVGRSNRPRSEVIPVLEPVTLAGVKISPSVDAIDPLACVVSDRDLYRAEDDLVHLFVAMPEPPPELRLLIECNGQSYTERDLELSGGMCMETLGSLLPGAYSAQLAIGPRLIGIATHFTVADYTLAPLTARLTSHHLDRGVGALNFELAAESYEVPFAGKLRVDLIDGERSVRHAVLRCSKPGQFAGRLKLCGAGPFRLRLTSVEDAERVAEVVVPGSETSERDVTVLNELGQEFCFSMMPDAGAIPIRGGYLSEGEALQTPLTVDSIVTDEPVIQVDTDVEQLVLVTLDHATGSFQADSRGSVAAGSRIVPNVLGPVTTVFVGCFVDDQPFEAYTTFVRPTRLNLEFECSAPATPADELIVRLKCTKAAPTWAHSGETEADVEIPVLLCVRDARLTATRSADVGLGAAMKRGIDTATEGMAESGFVDLVSLIRRPRWAHDELVRITSGIGPFNQLAGSDPVVQLCDSMLSADASEYLACLAKDELPTPAPRTEFAEVLFCGIVSVARDVVHDVAIPIGGVIGTFTVDAFSMLDGDWTRARDDLVLDPPVRADLELPAAVHPGDDVVGRLRAASGSGRARVQVLRNGALVELRDGRGDVGIGLVDTPAELEFDVMPGVYVARVEDADSGETDAVEREVGMPGRFRTYNRELGLLLEGDSITLDSVAALSLRVLPAVDESFGKLIKATASYAHLCCEQTAAKILAATFCYLTADEAEDRSVAERIIVAGVARERQMSRPQEGFAMYPESKNVSEHYSRLAVRYLWTLRQLPDVEGLSDVLRQAARDGVELADIAARAHRMEPVPERICTIEDAYAAATENGDKNGARKLVEKLICFGNGQVVPRNGEHAVADRALLAYGAATLIALGDFARGVRIANEVTRQFNDQGMLYSTVDSVAAIALMVQLRLSGLVGGDGILMVNGRRISAQDAADLSDQIETIEVIEGTAAVEVMRICEQDWSKKVSGFPLEFGFHGARGRLVKKFRDGDRVDLRVSLPDGYNSGDLVHVCLPPCLAWIRGGAKVKHFTVDFEGRDFVNIPLLVTSKLEGRQHFAVCVRNMFQEERMASPGLVRMEG